MKPKKSILEEEIKENVEESEDEASIPYIPNSAFKAEIKVTNM